MTKGLCTEASPAQAFSPLQSMIELRPILHIIGMLTATLGLFMLAPAAIDAAAGSPDWRSFALSAILVVFFGGGLAAASWGPATGLTVQQGFLLTVGSWVALVAAAALPLHLSSLNLSYTDAFFEAMSGLTTTGATVIVGLNEAPRGVLAWRALLQWLGGVGIVIMAIAILPMLQVGGMQLFRTESSDTSEKILPRASQIAGSIFRLYIVLTALCFGAYVLCGMGAFDAAAHAMTTIATGGFSTRDESFGAFTAGPADTVCTAFMMIGSLPFGLYLLAVRGQFAPLWTDAQVRFFLGAAAVFIAVMVAFQVLAGVNAEGAALRYAAFNVVSIMTGTGYATTDYGAWGPFAVSFFFCIMFVGGCAGSTSCGMKIFRLQVALAALRVHTRRVSAPHGVFTAKYNGQTLTDDVYRSVFSFFFVYVSCFAVFAIILSTMELEALTALSAVGSAIANVGPGLGPVVGPAGTYAPLPDAAKWVLSVVMLLGRLELFTVLVLFAPSFWRG